MYIIIAFLFGMSIGMWIARKTILKDSKTEEIYNKINELL